MARPVLLILVALAFAAPLTARAEDPPPDPKARFPELAKEYKEVRKSPDWEKIKKRRDIIVELGDIDHAGALDILFGCFAEDREQVCRIPAMIGVGKQGNFPALKALVVFRFSTNPPLTPLTHARATGLTSTCAFCG